MTRISKKLLHPQLSYKLTGIFFKIHNELGRFCREKQYADKLEELLKEEGVLYKREFGLEKLTPTSHRGNRVDFLVEDKILVDVKAKKFITKDDYFQMVRYLEGSGLELGMIVNFRNTYLKPKRVLNAKLFGSFG